MGKRGEGKSGHARHDAGRGRADASGRRISKLKNDPLSELKITSDMLGKEEKVIEKGISFAFGPSEFHVVTFVASLIILGFLLGSKGMIFCSVLVVGALAFAHFLSKHHRPHDILAIIWLFFIPLALSLALFADIMLWLLMGVVVISFVSTVILYYYHKKEHTLLKVMWQVTYSKMVAVTLALLAAAVLPLLFPDLLFSVFEMVFFYVFPVALIFFFTSKFLYLYFFDRKHLRSEVAKGLRHTLIYTLVFIISLMGMYSFFAAGLFSERQASISGQMSYTIVEISNVEKAVSNLPALKGLNVAGDLLELSAGLQQELAYQKAAIDEPLSFGEIVDDSYFTRISDGMNYDVQSTIRAFELVELKNALVMFDEEMSGMVRSGALSGEGAANLESYADRVAADVSSRFVMYSEDPDLKSLKDLLNSGSDRYSDFEDNGLYYWAAKEAGVDFVYSSDSILGRQLSVVMRHLRVFRDLARLVLNEAVFIRTEYSSPLFEERLYVMGNDDVSAMSRAIRYSTLKGLMDERESKLQSAGERALRVV